MNGDYGFIMLLMGLAGAALWCIALELRKDAVQRLKEMILEVCKGHHLDVILSALSDAEVKMKEKAIFPNNTH